MRCKRKEHVKAATKSRQNHDGEGLDLINNLLCFFAYSPVNIHTYTNEIRVECAVGIISQN